MDTPYLHPKFVNNKDPLGKPTIPRVNEQIFDFEQKPEDATPVVEKEENAPEKETKSFFNKKYSKESF